WRAPAPPRAARHPAGTTPGLPGRRARPRAPGPRPAWPRAVRRTVHRRGRAAPQAPPPRGWATAVRARPARASWAEPAPAVGRCAGRGPSAVDGPSVRRVLWRTRLLHPGLGPGTGDPVDVEDAVDAPDRGQDVPEVGGLGHLEDELRQGHAVAARLDRGREDVDVVVRQHPGDVGEQAGTVERLDLDLDEEGALAVQRPLDVHHALGLVAQ